MKRKERQAHSSSFLLMAAGQRGSCRGGYEAPSNRLVAFDCLHASSAHQTTAASFPNRSRSLLLVWSFSIFLGRRPSAGLYYEAGDIHFLSSPLLVSISCCQPIGFRTVNLKHWLKFAFLTYYMALYWRFHWLLKPSKSEWRMTDSNDRMRGQWDDLRSRIYRSGGGWQPIICSEAGRMSS